MSLVFVLCAVNYVYAVVVSALVLKQGRDETAWSYYAVSSFTYLTAMVTSNKALTWVNYPTQVVGKSCKPIPVMVLGVVIGRKRYPLLKYLFVLTIVAGVALFMYKGKVTIFCASVYACLKYRLEIFVLRWGWLKVDGFSSRRRHVRPG